MCSACRDACAVAALLLVVAAAGAGAGELRVCADPDNLPYSARDGSGFENRISALIARATGRELTYFWLPDRRGFIRKTLGAGECDVVVGVPEHFERTLNTPPYYRASYAFVYAPARLGTLSSLDDPRLARLRIGVALVGNDLAATPPALALARRGHTANVTGFPPFGEQPVGARMVDALERGAIDVAVLWGPQVGYFARRAATPLVVTPIAALEDGTFAIAMGVRRGDRALQRELTDALARLEPEIDAVLDAYAVPRIEMTAAEKKP